MIGVSLQHGLGALVKPIMQADLGGHLIAMNFIGGLQQRISQPTGHHKVGGHTPAILRVHFSLVSLEVARDKLPRSEEVSGLVLVVTLVGFGKKAGYSSSCKIVVFTK